MKYNMHFHIQAKDSPLFSTYEYDLSDKNLLSSLRHIKKKFEKINKRFNDPKNKDLEKWLIKYYKGT